MRQTLVLLGLLFVACGSSTNPPLPPIETPTDPGTPVEALGQLNLRIIGESGRELSWSMGDVPVGQVSTTQVHLRNEGTRALELRAIDGFAEADAFSASGLTLPATISPGEERVLTIAFLPVEAGFQSRQLTFRTTGERTERTPATLTVFGWAFTGDASQPQGCTWSTAVPNDIEAQVSCSATIEQELVATCSPPKFLLLKKVEILDASGAVCPNQRCPNFSLTQLSPAFQRDGFNRLSLPFAVNYHSAELGEDRATVRVSYLEDKELKRVELPLLGRAVERAPRLDVIPQHNSYMTDVLLVVDNGSTMAAHRESIAANLAEITEADASPCNKVNYAVVTSGAAPGALPSGAFVSRPGEPTVIRSHATPDFGNVLIDRVQVALQDGLESKPLSAMTSALDPAMLATTNSGFRRSGSKLSVWIITDRSDTSPGAVADYLTGFTTDHSISVAGGLGDYAACGIAPDDGRLRAAAFETRGYQRGICEDWTPPTTGWFPGCDEQVLTHFSLKTRPEPDESLMSVRVDGVDVPRLDSQGAPRWSYDYWSNALVFESSHVPPRDSIVEVEYWPLCVPPAP